jgi:SAM-dependent MidA family methyltransferase
MRQGDFLLSSGLAERAGALGTGKPKDVQDDIRSAVERLAGDGATGMGDLFKVLCIAAGPVDLAPFAGSHVSAG